MTEMFPFTARNELRNHKLWRDENIQEGTLNCSVKRIFTKGTLNCSVTGIFIEGTLNCRVIRKFTKGT